MPSSVVESEWKPLGGKLPAGAETYRRSQEADNVVGSYFQASDLLAEALQNAADAVDQRSEREAKAPRLIEVQFDPDNRRFSVADTGTGIDRDALDIVFQPNVTLKSGPLAPPSARSWRGEKGVGLSFLLFASDYLRIQTCDGDQRLDGEIVGALSWTQDPDRNPELTAKLMTSGPDTYLGSERYTIITIGEVDPNRFDRDLFEMSSDEVEWTLRTRTAVGNTAYLFEGIDVPLPEPIEVVMRYGAVEKDPEPRSIEYRYGTPEDLLERAEELGVTGEVPIHDFEDIRGLSAREMRDALRGAAVRYIAEFESASGYSVWAYMFAMEGNAMGAILRGLREHPAVEWAPPSWRGFWVATRDMPTGIPLRPGILPTRAYEQRIFGLLQWDELKLDVGRKSLHGRTAAMFYDVVRTAWQDDLRWVVERIPRVRRGSSASTLEIERRVRLARALDDLRAGVPFAKVPDRRSSVAAVFHQILGSSQEVIPKPAGITTGVFNELDMLADYDKSASTEERTSHLIFGLDQRDVLRTFDADKNDAETVDLAVLWMLVEPRDSDDEVARIEVEVLDGDEPDGATHQLQFGGLGGREEPLRVIELRGIVERLSDA